MTFIRTLGYAILRALASLQRRSLISALTVGVMTVALVLVGVAYMTERNVKALSEEWGSGVQMIVYLDEGTTDVHAKNLSDALVALPSVESVQHVSPTLAMEYLQDSLGNHDELLNGIEASFLPASIEVNLVAGVRNLVSAGPVIKRLEATPGVENVEFLGNWVDSFTSLIDQVQRAGMWLVAIASLIGIFTVVATMRLSADSRATELRVLRLMGAPAVLSHGPNLIEGAILGLMGAASAVVLLYALFNSGAPIIASSLQIPPSYLRFLAAKDLAQLGLFGLSLGTVGGLVTNYSQGRS